MTRLPRLQPLLVLLLTLLPIVLSCAETKRWMSSKDIAVPWSTVDDVPPPSVHAVELAEKHRAVGEYQKAIDTYKEAYQKQPDDKALTTAYVKSVEKIVSAADKAFDQQDFAFAGKTYDVLLKNKAHFKEFAKELSFNSTLLNEKIGFCKKSLYKQGFQEYRNGNIDEAIAVWQDLLAIDPNNTDIKETLRTAKLQQKNLRDQD